MEGRIHQLGELNDLKASNPVEVAEYAVATGSLRSQPSSGGYHMS
jgi:hypothetical protein